MILIITSPILTNTFGPCHLDSGQDETPHVMRRSRLSCAVARSWPHARGQQPMRYHFSDCSTTPPDPYPRRRQNTSAIARRLHTAARVSRKAQTALTTDTRRFSVRAVSTTASPDARHAQWVYQLSRASCSTTTPLLNETSCRLHLPAVYSVWMRSADQYIDGEEETKEGGTRRPSTARL